MILITPTRLQEILETHSVLTLQEFFTKGKNLTFDEEDLRIIQWLSGLHLDILDIPGEEDPL